jgi:hypothetical protein
MFFNCKFNIEVEMHFFCMMQGKLGKWRFKGKRHGSSYEGYMFPLLVQEQLEIWPEQSVRQRTWVSKISSNNDNIAYYISCYRYC